MIVGHAMAYLDVQSAGMAGCLIAAGTPMAPLADHFARTLFPRPALLHTQRSLTIRLQRKVVRRGWEKKVKIQ